MNSLFTGFIVVLLLSYSLAFLNITISAINISVSLVGGVGIQSVFAQQDNSTVDEDTVSEDTVSEDTVSEDTVSEDTVSEDTVDDRNALPVADDKHIETNQNEPIDIQLTGSDAKRKEQTELAKKLH